MFAFIGRWRRRRRLLRALDVAQEIEIEGLGTVNVHRMPVGLQLALRTAVNDEGEAVELMSLYAWIVTQCVDEFIGYEAHELAMECSPMVLQELGNAVLDLSGMTSQAQDDAVKKSEADRPSSSSSISA